MAMMVVFTVDASNNVKGEFTGYLGTEVMLLGTPAAPIHAWRTGVDSCNVMGCPCPLQPMTAYSIPNNAFAKGTYSIGTAAPGPGRQGGPQISNGTIVVGSGPGDPGPAEDGKPSHGRPDR